MDIPNARLETIEGQVAPNVTRVTVHVHSATCLCQLTHRLVVQMRQHIEQHLVTKDADPAQTTTPHLLMLYASEVRVARRLHAVRVAPLSRKLGHGDLQMAGRRACLAAESRMHFAIFSITGGRELRQVVCGHDVYY